MKTRKQIRMVLSVVLVAVMLLLTAAPAFAQGVVIKGEPDGQSKSTIMEEYFRSGTLDPSFTSDSVEVVTDSYGMHFSGTYSHGSALVLTAYKLKDYNKFTFSIDTLQSNNDFIYLGFGGAKTNTMVDNYDFNLCIANSVTAVYEMAGMTWKQVGSAPLSNALTAGKSTDFAITLQKVSGNQYKVTFEIIEDGEVVVTTDYGKTVRMENPDGYVCMWGGTNEQFQLRDFKAYDSEKHLAFSDDFSDSSITYSNEPATDGNWHINAAGLTKEDVFISRNAGPEFKQADDVITASSKLVSNDKVSKPYEISFKAKIKKLDKNAIFGMYLGAKEAGDLDSATIIGVSANDDKYATVNLIQNGKTVDYGDTDVPISVLNIDDTAVDFEVIIGSDYSILFSVGGVQFTFRNVDYDGYWGICNYSLDNESASDVGLEEVKVVQNTYAACAQPDLSNDFGGIKLTQDGFEEYYISDRTYYMGPGVALRPKGAFTKEPSLYFENANAFSGFAPKQKYTDYILQFDLKVVSEGQNGQRFGISFGKDAYATDASHSTSINFEYYAWGTDPYTQMNANLCTFDDGTKAKAVEGYHFYKDQDTKYNFMLVAKNRSVYVYFKEDSEDISQLGICRAVIPDVDTAGYVCLFGLNGVSFDVMNYKLTNLAPEATEDSAIALRENFGKETLSDKLTTTETATVKDGAMQLSGGSLEMKNASRYYIADFTLLEANADLTIDFSENKSLTISKDLKEVTVKDGSKEKKIDVSEYNLADYRNTQFQLILQYDALSIAAKGIYESYDTLSSPIVTYTFADPVAEGILKWTSEDALLDDVSVYALDDSYEAETVDYEDDPNDTNIWIPKDIIQSDNDRNNGGIPTLFIVIYSVIGAAILALLGAIIVSSRKKRGEKQ